MLLVAVGRRPYTEGLGLDDGRRRSSTSAAASSSTSTSPPTCRASTPSATSIPGPMLAHKAEEEGVAAVERMAGLRRPRELRRDPERRLHPPGARRRRPQRGRLRAARPARCASARFPFAANGRARGMGETDGQVKVIADADDRPRPRHPHPRPARLGPDRRGGAGDGVLRQRRGHRPLGARAPDPGRGVKEAALAVDGRPLNSECVAHAS